MKLLDIRKYSVLVSKKINEYTESTGKLISEKNPTLLAKSEEALKKFNENTLTEEEKNEIFLVLTQYYNNPVSLPEEEIIKMLMVTREEIESCFVEHGEEEKSV